MAFLLSHFYKIKLENKTGFNSGSFLTNLLHSFIYNDLKLKYYIISIFFGRLN
jgi:hypothetical protein